MIDRRGQLQDADRRGLRQLLLSAAAMPWFVPAVIAVTTIADRRAESGYEELSMLVVGSVSLLIGGVGWACSLGFASGGWTSGEQAQDPGWSSVVLAWAFAAASVGLVLWYGLW